jgi:hypothetical protein
MQDVMVDLETLGTLPGSVILSIGAVAFDEFGVAEEGFYRAIRRDSCEAAGLQVSAETQAWWDKQSLEARAVLVDRSAVSLEDALRRFNEWIAHVSDSPDVRVWGNGANFDNPLLACAYDAVNVKPLYKFWNERCYRTVKNQYPDIKLIREGTYHNALDDARCQAEHLVRICQMRGWSLV